MDEYVDVLIPRGGRELIERIDREASMPVLKHLDGICHIYIDEVANDQIATDVTINAKTQRYSACNSLETLLVHEAQVSRLLPGLLEKFSAMSVEIRGCNRVSEVFPDAVAASESDWVTEYLGPVLAVKVVSSLDEAINHINTYGSQHTDSIITDDYHHANQFVREVDSSSVMVNVSTRLADGYQYNLGGEIGISTDRLHARGPVGLEGLTNQKFVVFGEGQVRGE
jgi:glutamate-5-semialdehyde dehydrogenase